MNLTQLKYFKVLAETQHLMKTADILFVTPPTISNSIKALEAELGVPLFDRVGRNIRLNEHGASFLPYVIQALQCLEDGKRLLSNAAGDTGSIRFCLRDMALFGELIRMFLERYPNIEVNSLEEEVDDAGNIIWSRDLDFAITAKDLTSNKKLASRLLYEDPFVLAVSTDNPLAAMKSCRLSDLRDETFLMRNTEDYFQQCSEALLAENGFVPHKTIRVNYTTRPYLLKTNAGVSITTIAFCRNRFFNEDLQKIVPIHVQEFEGKSYVYRAYWRKDFPLSPAAKVFLSLLAECGNSIVSNTD